MKRQRIENAATATSAARVRTKQTPRTVQEYAALVQDLTADGNGAADHLLNRLKYSLAWEEVDLLLSNASMTKMSFSPRPDQVPQAGGVFAETQGMHRRGLSVDSDRYTSSGANAGATRWPSFPNSKIQRKYFTATVNGGQQHV
eukprot:SAG31_NODE_9564_length_1258_cov_1.432269_1_plen_143_part_01